MNNIIMFLILAAIHGTFIFLSLTVNILSSIVQLHVVCSNCITWKLGSPCFVVNFLIVIKNNTRLLAHSFLR